MQFQVFSRFLARRFEKYLTDILLCTMPLPAAFAAPVGHQSRVGRRRSHQWSLFCCSVAARSRASGIDLAHLRKLVIAQVAGARQGRPRPASVRCFFQLVNVVCPALHELSPLGDALAAVVDTGDAITFDVRELQLNQR
jgi:hypothetical protein